MDTVDTRTMDTAGPVTTVAAVTDTAMAADQDIPGVSGVGDKPVRFFEIARPLSACRAMPTMGELRPHASPIFSKAAAISAAHFLKGR